MNDPIPNNAQRVMSGVEPRGNVANDVDHKQGCNSKKVPMGLSSRARWAYGWRDFGR